MNIEKIYNELREINEVLQVASIKDLMSKIEVEIRKDACYNTTSKTRVNAIKRIASKREDRRALQGYGVFGDYKGVTDSYHAILIKQDAMPLSWVTTESECKKLGIDYKEYKNKYGENSIINGVYPNLMNCITFDYSKENPLKLDLDDLIAFIKLHKGETSPLYKLGEGTYNPTFIKNVIDVIGKECEIYYQGEYKPLYFVNKNNEIGIVLPIRKY